MQCASDDLLTGKRWQYLREEITVLWELDTFGVIVLPSDDKSSDMINAAANLAKAVPVYEDALQPVMKETGKALGTAGRVVNVALSPIRGLVWGAEKIESWLETSVAQRLEGVDESEITVPDLAIAGPTIESLKFNGHKPELSEMFANLLASAMKRTTADSVHPSFVNMISSMSALDAQIFAAIASQNFIPTIHINRQVEGASGHSTIIKFYCTGLFEVALQSLGEMPGKFDKYQASIENLVRLGLVSAVDDGHLTSEKNLERYVELDGSELLTEFNKEKVDNISFKSAKSYLAVTVVGRLFRDTVL